MILTGLAPDPRRPDYRLVEVDRGRFASLPAADLEPLNLVVGAELSGLVAERLQELADREAAHRAALRAVARRAHARFDLRRRLLQKQHPVAAVEAALDRLTAAGLLDDARFARDYASAKVSRGRGPARLIRDLQAQGVERRVAEEAVRRSLAAEGVDPGKPCGHWWRSVRNSSPASPDGAETEACRVPRAAGICGSGSEGGSRRAFDPGPPAQGSTYLEGCRPWSLLGSRGVAAGSLPIQASNRL